MNAILETKCNWWVQLYWSKQWAIVRGYKQIKKYFWVADEFDKSQFGVSYQYLWPLDKSGLNITLMCKGNESQLE